MQRSAWRSDVALISLAVATLVIHFIIASGYGFHRDELATLDDARHLTWGFVAYPPLTPLFGRLSLILFGTSLIGFRFFAAVAAALAIVITGLMAREMGGRRTAQLIAASATVPFCLGSGSLMQYVAFDFLWWVLAAYFFIRLIKSSDARYWIPIGLIIGLGMLTKYTILFCVAGIVAAVLFSNLRAHLKNKWLWIGAALSILICAPNLIWQFRHQFVSLDFLRHIHARDVRIGRTKDFLPDQLALTFLSAPVAIAGLYFFGISRDGGPFRASIWLYAVPLALFIVAQARGYYLAPAYCLLYAGGSVWLVSRFNSLPSVWSRCANSAVWIVLTANIGIAAAVALPIAPINSRWWDFAVKLNSDLPEEIGWPDLVATIARVRDSVDPAERPKLGILAGNYGEAGAINLYRELYHLPPAISGVNSFWERSYPDPPPETLVLIGFSQEFAETYFESFEKVAVNKNKFGVANEETREHPDIFVCRRLRQRWPDFWKTFRRYG